MAGDDRENLGLQVAHTPGENFGGAAIAADQAKAAKLGTVRATVEAAMGDLVEQFGQSVEDDQPSLLLDEMDEQQALFRGPVRHVAKQIEASRRGRGRPKGSQNKASREFADTLMRMGYRHPGINLAEMANADPAALALELGLQPDAPDGVEPVDWLRALVREGKLLVGEAQGLIDKAYVIIGKANAELLPYFESKAPTKLNVDKKSVLGVMVIGDMGQAGHTERTTLDLTKVDAPT